MRLKSVIPNIIIVLNIIKLNATDSTNTYLKHLAKETSLPDETVILAERQLAGRGQMGNTWFSQQGLSLTFSAYKEFRGLEVGKQFAVAMEVSLAIAEAMDALGIPEISIKWPNDILADRKKIGGILIENVLEGHFIKYSIIGIGINVNQLSFPHLPQAGSLKLSTDKDFDTEEVFQILVKRIFKGLNRIPDKDFSEIKRRYEERLFLKDQIAIFENTQGKPFNGEIRGVSDRGELLIETEKKQLQSFQFKEVKMIY